MLQTAFGASCLNWASVFERHKRFKEGRESVRDDESCGRSKEVRIPELIGQIKNFMDKDRRVSIKTISAQFDVSVGIEHINNSKELKMLKIFAKFVPRVLREDQKEGHWHDSREMVELINSGPAVLNALGSHWTDSQQEILCWGFKGVQEENPSEEVSSLQIGSVVFPPWQCTSPCHRLFDQDGHQDSFSASL